MGAGKKGSSRRDVRRRVPIHHDCYEKGVSSVEKRSALPPRRYADKR
jgi:hypothetical protein